jgi:hypothetical protein
MIEQAAVSRRAHKRYSTLCSVFLHGLWMLGVLSVLAWFLLIAWVGGMAFTQNTHTAKQAIHLLAHHEMEWLARQNLSYCQKAALKIIQFESQCQQNVAIGLKGSELLLQKIHCPLILIDRKKIETWATILIDATVTVLSRLSIFILSFPLWITLFFIMIVDGLVQRGIRQFQAARESTFLFHRLKSFAGKIGYFFFLLYMGQPGWMQPATLLLPMIGGPSLLTRLAIKYYKKYV